MMYDHEKSDPAIVAVKPTNKAGQPAAELAEPRAGAEGNVSQQSTGRAQYRGTVSQALERIRQAARVASPSDTQGGSRMPELGPYGSVRGARGNSRPYRERHLLGLSSSQFDPQRTSGTAGRCSISHSPPGRGVVVFGNCTRAVPWATSRKDESSSRFSAAWQSFGRSPRMRNSPSE